MPDRQAHPLYDRRFEHDACGVGFVADAGGRSRAAGPAARPGRARLARPSRRVRRGRGVERRRGRPPAARAERPRPDSLRVSPAGPASSRCSCPGRAGRRATARVGSSKSALAEERLPAPRWRTVPVDPSALGSEAAATRPDIAQASSSVRPGCPMPGSSSASSSPGAGWRPRPAGQARRLAGFAVPSASCRSVVYKGLVAGERLAELYPDLAADLPLSHAIFHQRYATNTHPEWRLAQPFRAIAHNGEINTIRTNREQVHGRAGDPLGAPGSAAHRLVEAGPLLSPDGSDSLSLDEALELLVATGWSLEAALLALVPEATALLLDRSPARRGVRPPDGRLPGAVGRPGGARVRGWAAGRRARRSERAPAARVRGHPRAARRGGIGGGRGADRARRDRPARSARAGRDAARRPAPRGDPRGCRGEDRDPPPLVATGRAAVDVRRRPTGRSAARGGAAVAPTGPAGHEPAVCAPRRPRRRAGPARHPDDGRRGEASRSGAWATTRRRRPGPGSTGRSPTTSARRSPRSPTRRSTPSASARSWTSASSSAGDPALLGGIPTGPRTVRLDRPVVADLDGLLGRIRLRRRPPARRDLGPGRWSGGPRPARSTGWRPTRSSPSRRLGRGPRRLRPGR